MTALKQLRDEVSQHQSLGDSQSNAEILLHEHQKREAAAKVSSPNITFPVFIITIIYLHYKHTRFKENSAVCSAEM